MTQILQNHTNQVFLFDKSRGIQLKFKEARTLYFLPSRGPDKIIIIINIYFYMDCTFTFRYMRGHVTKNTVSVQGFPPEIYTI